MALEALSLLWKGKRGFTLNEGEKDVCIWEFPLCQHKKAVSAHHMLLPIYLYIRLSICLSTYLSIYLPSSYSMLSNYLSVCYLSIRMLNNYLAQYYLSFGMSSIKILSISILQIYLFEIYLSISMLCLFVRYFFHLNTFFLSWMIYISQCAISMLNNYLSEYYLSIGILCNYL